MGRDIEELRRVFGEIVAKCQSKSLTCPIDYILNIRSNKGKLAFEKTVKNGIFPDLLKEREHVQVFEDRIRDALDSTDTKKSFEKTVKNGIFPDLLKEREHVQVFEDRIRDALDSTDTKKSFEKLLNEPKCAMENAAKGPLFFFDTSKNKGQKGDQTHQKQLMNKENELIYCCVYVIALLQAQNGGYDKMFERHRVSLEMFKALHRDDVFEVRRRHNDKEKGCGTKKKKTVLDYFKMSEFDESEWERLYQFRNIFILCFIISPEKRNRETMFVDIASILIDGKRAALGGAPPKIIPAVKNVVFKYLSSSLFSAGSSGSGNGVGNGSKYGILQDKYEKQGTIAVKRGLEVADEKSSYERKKQRVDSYHFTDPKDMTRYMPCSVVNKPADLPDTETKGRPLEGSAEYNSITPIIELYSDSPAAPSLDLVSSDSFSLPTDTTLQMPESRGFYATQKQRVPDFDEAMRGSHDFGFKDKVYAMQCCK